LGAEMPRIGTTKGGPLLILSFCGRVPG